MQWTRIGEKPLVLDREYRDVDGNTVKISVCAPVYEPDEGAWYCRVSITGDEAGYDGRVPGIDGFDALLGALRVLEARLVPISHRLHWMGNEKGSSCLPAMIADSYGIKFKQRLKVEVLSRQLRWTDC
jgi:Domain of unknown function (DUF6968)